LLPATSLASSALYPLARSPPSIPRAAQDQEAFLWSHRSVRRDVGSPPAACLLLAASRSGLPSRSAHPAFCPSPSAPASHFFSSHRRVPLRGPFPPNPIGNCDTSSAASHRSQSPSQVAEKNRPKPKRHSPGDACCPLPAKQTPRIHEDSQGNFRLLIFNCRPPSSAF